MSIKSKLLLSFLSAAALMGILAGTMLYHNVKQADRLARREVEAVAKTAAAAADQIIRESGDRTAGNVGRRLQSLVLDLQQLNTGDITVVDGEKKVIAGAVQSEIGRTFPHDLGGDVDRTMKDGKSRLFTETSPAYPQGINRQVVALGSKSGKPAGALILEYAPLRYGIAARIKSDALWLILFCLAALSAPFSVGYILYRHIASPLHDIQKTLFNIASGDLNSKITPERNDEIGSVAASINAMSSQLSKSRNSLMESNRNLEREISERKRAEKELNDALKRMGAEKSKADAVIQGLGVGIIIQDLNYRIQYENDLQKRLLGDHVGELCFQAYEGKEQICDDCPMVTSLQDGGIYRTERCVPSQEGDAFFELVSSPLRDGTGAIIGGIKMVRNVTERKRADRELDIYRTRLEELVATRSQQLNVLNDQLRHAQKMEAVGQLAGGIAHDFNNILSAIINCATIMQMDLSAEDPLMSYVDQILASSDRAANLTQSLLAFSRKQVIRTRPIHLNDIIRGVEELLVRVIGENIEFRTDLTDRDLTVMADAGQIEQVLMNLATNARDALSSGGRLTISSERIVIDDQFTKAHGYGTPGVYAQMSISDTGIGIDEEIRSRIFEPFFTTKAMGKGTGLGLSIVYGIVKQHLGYINVYSEKNTGTVFNIYLPIVSSPENHEQLPQGEQVLPRGREMILLAEDDKALRELARRLLERFGYRVIEAENGKQAVDAFRGQQDAIDLLVFDMIMPKMNGKEAYEVIKQIKPSARILFMSGYAADLIGQEGAEGRGFTIIQKPLLPADFLKKIRDTLDGSDGTDCCEPPAPERS